MTYIQSYTQMAIIHVDCRVIYQLPFDRVCTVELTHQRPVYSVCCDVGWQLELSKDLYLSLVFDLYQRRLD